jgi:hypothetical protein
VSNNNLLFWIMVIKCPGDWRYIKAEPPCMKGEIDMSFKFFNVVIGWQK